MVSKKPKLLWISDWLLINSGYGIQTAGILNGLKEMFTVYHLGLQFHGQPFVLNDIWQIPNGKDAWCNDKMKERIDQIKPDYIVTLMDLFRPCNWLQEQDKYLKQKGAKTIAYFPLDGEPVPFSTVYPVNRWEQFDYLVPMSHYGRRTLLNELPELKDKVTEPIWHGINTSVFKPIPKKDNEFYKQNEKVLKGKFVVSSVFRNINRKNPMALIYAWKKFSKDKKDICLVLHTNPNEFPPTNLAKLITNFNLNDNVMFTARDEFYFSHPPDFVNWIYNASQVHVLPSCYLPDTDIVTTEGLKPIKDIKIGDKVLTRLGTFNKVINKIEPEKDTIIQKIKCYYVPEISLTDGHEVFVVKNPKPKCDYTKKKIKKNPQIVKIPAREVKKGDFMVFPRIKKTIKPKILKFKKSTVNNQFGKTKYIHPTAKQIKEVKITPNLMWLFGVYLAEGCVAKHKTKVDGIGISISTKEIQLTLDILNSMKKHFGIDGVVRDNSRNRRTVWFYSAVLGRTFEKLFNQGAHNKTIPFDFLYYPKKYQKELIKGLWIGDGWIGKNKRMNSIEFSYTTVSKQLAHRIWMILLRLGCLATIRMQKRQSEVWIIKGYGKDFYKLFGMNFEAYSHSRGWLDKDYAYLPVMYNKKDLYSGRVYDLTVETEHSYCTLSFCGKNTGEGFGIPIIEAMAAGKPNILTDYTTSGELINFGKEERIVDFLKFVEGGCLIPYKHYPTNCHELTRRGFIEWEILADAFEWYYQTWKKDPNELERRYKDVCRNHALQHFDWNTILPQWKQLFEKILKENGQVQKS